MTPKQKLQKDRAWFKYVLTGLIKPVALESLTGPELFAWNQIKGHVKVALEEFDKHSRELGLNIPEHRCWCGKPAKVQVDYYGTDELQWVCNKHITND